MSVRPIPQPWEHLGETGYIVRETKVPRKAYSNNARSLHQKLCQHKD